MAASSVFTIIQNFKSTRKREIKKKRNSTQTIKDHRQPRKNQRGLTYKITVFVWNQQQRKPTNLIFNKP